MAGAGQGVVIPSGARGLSGTGAVRLFNSNGFCPECDCDDDTIETPCNGCVRVPRTLLLTISGVRSCPGCVGVSRWSGAETINGTHTLTLASQSPNCFWQSGQIGGWTRRVHQGGYPGPCSPFWYQETGYFVASASVFRQSSPPNVGWLGASAAFSAIVNGQTYNWGGASISWPAAPPPQPNCTSFSFSGQVSGPNPVCVQFTDPPFNFVDGLYGDGPVSFTLTG